MSVDKYNQVEKEFLSRSTKRGGILLLKSKDAIECIKRCKELGYKILGIDGFYLKDKETLPSLENSFDFEWAQYKNKIIDTYDFAIQFIKDREVENLYFEIVSSL